MEHLAKKKECSMASIFLLSKVFFDFSSDILCSKGIDAAKAMAIKEEHGILWGAFSSLSQSKKGREALLEKF